MLIDPRFKDTLLNDKDDAPLLEKKAIENFRKNTNNIAHQNTQQIQSSQAEPAIKKSKWSHLKIKKDYDFRNMNIPTEEAKIKAEVRLSKIFLFFK